MGIFPDKENMSPDRPLIAFFDYHDVFEDFYPHYGVDQHSFSTLYPGI